ncbi:MAG: FHA domain-containing protein [Myxococcales bacterium]|nr:FHA domain-containing protein [Myxococcales bacterium]
MSDIETQLQPRREDQVVTTLRVDVIDGPDKGKTWSSSDAISVGTARDNALTLSDFTVSRYHLEVTARPGGIVVSDLGSTTGRSSARSGSSAPRSPPARWCGWEALRSGSRMPSGAPFQRHHRRASRAWSPARSRCCGCSATSSGSLRRRPPS